MSLTKAQQLSAQCHDNKYDNYYEIFVYSFFDSNGDGIGDLRGVAEKLDYVKDMGYTAIWLMPICQANSYHKYNVVDYMAIDSQYGTMQDFEYLLDKAHGMGIKIILDMVFNHTSDQHPWFIAATKDAQSGNVNGKYYNYYNFSATNKAGYSTVDNSDIFYEAQFFGGMPDLNLDNPEVRDELEQVIKFWLNKGVDGFRLDACTSFYTGNVNDSADFVQWINQTCQKYSANTYIVGESWTTRRDIRRYYQSGADSFFYFPIAKNDGYIFQTFFAPSSADYFYKAMCNLLEDAQGHIPAPFLDNHDTPRIASLFERNIDRIKFAYGLLCTLNGNVFAYYGDEIGMISYYNDPDKRLGMLWDNAQRDSVIAPPGVSKQEYCFDGVKQQQQDANSILNYYKRCNKMRNDYPAIARGTIDRLPYNDSKVLIVTKNYDQQSVTIVINFDNEAKRVNLPIKGKLVSSITLEGSVTFDKGVLTMPRHSISVIK